MKFDGVDMDGFDDPMEFFLMILVLLMILLNAHNILSLVSTIPIGAHSLEEFSMVVPEVCDTWTTSIVFQ